MFAPLIRHCAFLLSFMRGIDSFTENLLTMRRLEDFIPAHHALRPIRQITSAALAKMEGLLTRMYEADARNGRPSIAPEKLLRAMLLQVLYSVRSAGQLMEQVQYNMLFRWFAGSLVCPWTMRCGCQPCSRRTVNA